MAFYLLHNYMDFIVRKTAKFFYNFAQVDFDGKMTIFDKKPFERGLLFFKSTLYNIYYVN